MALNMERVTVGTVRASLKSVEADGIYGQTVLATNRATNSVFVGDSTVTVDNGYEVSAGQSVKVALEKVEDFFVVAAQAGNRVDVLRTGV